MQYFSLRYNLNLNVFQKGLFKWLKKCPRCFWCHKFLGLHLSLAMRQNPPLMWKSYTLKEMWYKQSNCLQLSSESCLFYAFHHRTRGNRYGAPLWNMRCSAWKNKHPLITAFFRHCLKRVGVSAIRFQDSADQIRNNVPWNWNTQIAFRWMEHAVS